MFVITPRFAWICALYICIVLALSYKAHAQACDYSVTAVDSTCTSQFDCQSTSSCTVLAFTPACSGYYDLIAETTCSGSGCESFNSCVDVYDGSTHLGSNCHLNPCTGCEQLCVNSVCLTANQEYNLVVCLMDCEGGQCVSPANGPCSALGSVKFNATHCP